jgi:Tol biopolymer transport system component
MRRNGWLRSAVAFGIAASTSMALLGATPAHAAWSGANGKIIFTEAHRGTEDVEDEEIFSINPDGTGQTAITDNLVDDDSPSVSPNGTKIAFIRYLSSGSEIFTMNVNGSGATRLTTTNPNELNVSWSPDGAKLFYTRVGGDLDHEIYSMNADGTGTTQLTNNDVDDDEPVVSPDGTKVLFERKSATTHHFDLWTMNTDGSGAAMLFDCSDTKHCMGPDWSPDGTKITYARWFWNQDPDSTVSTIYVANADGTNRTPVTSDGNYYNYSAFSPDGTYLVWSGGPTDDIWRYNLNTQGLYRLFLDKPDDWGPDWARA